MLLTVVLAENLPSLQLQQNPVHLLISVLQQRHLEVGSSLKYVVMSWQKLRYVEHVELC